MAENKTVKKNDTNDVEVEQTSIDYFHQHSQTPIETSSEDHFDSNQKYRPNYLNIFLTVFVICGFAVVLTIACINLIQIHQSTNTIMVDQLFNYVLIDNDAVKKDTSLIFQTSVNLTIADNYTSLIGVKSKLCQSLLENLKSTCRNGIETCETDAFYNFLSKLSSSTLNSTFQTYKFDWAKNVTAAKLIEISSEYYLDIDVENVKVMYWMVFGFNYNTTAPTIDDTSSSSGKSANLISVLEKSIESIYSSCGWFYLDVIHLETIRLTKRPNSFIS